MWNEQAYLDANPDVAAAVKNKVFTTGWAHYQAAGQTEARTLAPTSYGTVSYSTFNSDAYLAANPDVAIAVKAGTITSAWAHLKAFGYAEQRSLTPTNYGTFSESSYLDANPDVAAAVKAGSFATGWQHYAKFGSAEGRLTVPTAYNGFSEAAYLAANPDVAAAVAAGSIVTGWKHYITYGVNEGRLLAPAGYVAFGATGTTYTLTTGVDDITGTAGNDIFNGLSGATAAATTDTLSTTDILNGGAGTDTLNITVTAANTDVTHGALISNIETVNIRNTAATTVAASYAAGTGVTTVSSNLSTGDVTITALATGAHVGYIGNGVVVNGALSASYAATATGAATLDISGGTTIAAGTTGNVALIGAATTSTVINSTGAANQIGTVTNAATSKSIVINAATGLTTGAWATGTDTSITVTGAASTGVALTVANDGVNPAVNLGAITAAVTTIDASAMTAGGLGVTLIAGITSFKGGQGTDKVGTAALTLTTASIIDAGAGTDTLVVNATADVATAAKAKQYANFENVDFASAQTGDMALFTNSTITGIKLGGAAAGATNITATQAANITVYATETTPTFGVVGATTVGQLDTIKLTFDDGLTAKSTLSMGAFTAAGVETINVVANDHTTLSSLLNATALTSMTVTGAGNVSITTAALVVNPNTVIDASAVTGTVTIDATSATTNGLLIKGSLTKANTLTGSAQADTIIGGVGNDTITGLAGANIMTGGGGADNFVVAATGVLPSSSSFQTITDLSKAAGATTYDTISATALILGSQTAAAGSGVATLTAGVATFNAADTTFAQHLAAVAAAQQTTAGATTIWQEGADSYVFISDGTLAVGTGDTLIKLVGVTAGALTVSGNAITAIA